MAESKFADNSYFPYLTFIGGGSTYLASNENAPFLIFGKRGSNVILDVVTINLGAVQKLQLGATSFITYSVSNGVLKIATESYTQAYALCPSSYRINKL